MKPPKVAVVTVTYNSTEVLEDFLTSLEAQSGVGVHLYAVDNASRDSSLEALQRYASAGACTIIANDYNAGIAVGNNQGIERAVADGCDWILLLNNDTVFSARFIGDLVETARVNRVSILSPVIEATSPPGSIWYRDGAILPYKAMKAKHVDMGLPMPSALQSCYQVNYASTCALLVDPSVFAAVGLMDPIYFVYGDDVDFCLRARKAGYKYHVAGNLTLIHKASSLTGEFTAPFAVRWISRNWVVVARRHCRKRELAVGALYIGLWTLGRALLRKETLRVTFGRVRAFVEGMRLDLTETPPALPHGTVLHPKNTSGDVR